MTRRGCIGLWAVWLALMCPGAVFAAPATCRAGVPSPADQHRVQSLLRQLYKAEYGRTAAADRADLARRFLDQAQETLHDPAGQLLKIGAKFSFFNWLAGMIGRVVQVVLGR